MVKSKSIFSNFIWRLAERCGAQVVTLVVSIVLARLLDPVVYGTVALVTVITSILQVFVDSGMGNALIQKKNADIVDFSTVFFFNIALCAVLYVALFFCAPLIAKFYNMPDLTPVIRVLGTIIIISGVKNVQQAYVSKHLLFKRFFWATLGGTITAAVVGIWMAYAGYGVWALVTQYLVNAAMDTIILWITVKFRPKFVFSFQRLKGLFSFGWKLLVSALLDTGYRELRSLIIGKKYSSEDLAFYNQGNKYPGYVTTNVNSSIDSVLLPVMSEEQDNREHVKNMTRRAIKTSSFILWPLMMGLAACAEPVVSLLLTDKWLPCVIYLRIFCITYAFYPIHTANLNAIKAMGRSDLFLIMEIIKKALGLALIFGFMWISVEAMAWSCIIASVCGQIINSWPNKKLLKYSYLEQLKDILPSIGLSVVMAVAVYAIHFIGLSNWLTLLIQIPLGAVIYIAGAKIFKFEAFGYLISVAKGFLHKNMVKPTNKENMKKILIMGANPETVSLIKKAKEMSLFTIVTDNNPNAFAKKYADKAIDIDAMDVNALVAFCISEKVDGVMVGVAEALLLPYYEVCSKLGFPCFSNPEQFFVMTHKDVFKNACIQNNVPTIEEYYYNELEGINYPVIVKPTDACSSKGITVCKDREELEKAVAIAKEYSRSNTFLIEKYMTGDEVISYYIIQDGNPIFMGMCDRYTYKQSEKTVQLPTSYIFPSRHIDSYMDKTDPYIKNMIKNLGLQNGSLFFQCFVDEQGIARAYEPGYRLNGAQEHLLFSPITGIDAKELYINYALHGKESEKDLEAMAKPKHKEICCKLSPLVKTGKIKRIAGLDEIQKLENVVAICPSYNEGDEVTGYGTLKQIICRFFIVAQSKEDLIETINSINRLFNVDDENDESMLLEKFDVNIIKEKYE